MLMIDPHVMSPDFAERLAGLAGLIMGDGGRIPWSGRMAKREQAASHGIEVNDSVWQTVCDMSAS